MNSSIVTQSFTILGVDGNHVSVSETSDRKEVVLSIQQNDEHGRIATVRLSAAQFGALCELRWDISFDVPKTGDLEILPVVTLEEGQ